MHWFTKQFSPQPIPVAPRVTLPPQPLITGLPPTLAPLPRRLEFSCDEDGGRCAGGCCFWTGVFMGLFTGSGTSALILMHNEKTKMFKEHVIVFVLACNFCSCFFGGILGGTKEECADPGFNSALEGSMMIPGMIIAILAL